VALPNVALPIARGQRGCLTKNPQSARPLVCGHEREANGTKQDKRGDHRQTFSSPPTMPQVGPYGRKIQTETLPAWRTEADALDWIANVSADWLEKRRVRAWITDPIAGLLFRTAISCEASRGCAQSNQVG
jgi:hypothetical protein